MAEQTNIEWADSTANLWIGCTKVSPGCDNCYAERDWDLRKHRVEWGAHGARSYSKAGWALIRKFERAAVANGGVDPELGRIRFVFVNSLSDIADNHPSIVWRGDAFELFEQSPHVIKLLLTKRPQNVPKLFPKRWLEPGGWPAHVWLGTTVENQEEADRRIPHLLAAPAAARFLSCEPLLGPVDLTSIDPTGHQRAIGASGWSAIWKDNGLGRAWADWVICGGESGRNARPMHPDWARSLRDQCAAAEVPFLFKQWGEWAPDPCGGLDSLDRCLVAREMLWHDGHWNEQSGPHYLRRNGGEADHVYRLGKKAAGRLLDGIEHNGRPS